MSVLQLIAIAIAIVGVLFVSDALINAFGSTNPGKARRTLNRVATLGMKGVVIYIVAMLLFTVSSGLSPEQSVHSVVGNILCVVVTVAIAAVFLSDFFPSKADK